jgi:hypothetical protein
VSSVGVARRGPERAARPVPPRLPAPAPSGAAVRAA